MSLLNFLPKQCKRWLFIFVVIIAIVVVLVKVIDLPNIILKKIYQKSILNSIESLGLYIWYLDDGSLTKKKENNQVVANILYLNTQAGQNQNQIIIDWFFEKFHIKFYQYKDHKYYRLLCGTKEARKFLSIISKYKNEVPSMIYKFDIKPEPATR